MPLKSVDVGIKLGPIALSGTWEPDESERSAAWEMYVELATRVSTQPLEEGQGLLREALASLHALFGITREILRRHGPTVARRKGEGDYSFAEIAVYVLNSGIRPILTKWHPLLRHHESLRPPDSSPIEHERAWERDGKLRAEIEALRVALVNYANLLADVAEVEPLGTDS